MSARKRVCLVSLDFIGPIRNGGIGTAMTALAEALAADGHDVTMLYPSAYTETRPLTCWIMEYRKKGINFETLFADEPELALSYLVYHWLKQRDFDVVHFHDWRGIGYWSFVAKRQGLAFARTTLVCQVHGQTLWHLKHSGEFLSNIGQLRLDFVEQRSVELADIVYSPSHYMLRWMRECGWRVPAHALVWPNVMPRHYNELPIFERAVGSMQQINEIVFFGRLETRKGVELFCDAISRALATGLVVRRITFLGKEGFASGEPATACIFRATKDWKVPYSIVNNLDTREARSYLAGDGRLAVIASAIENSPYTVLECLADRIPFLAADVGGVSELIAESDRDAILFQRDVKTLAIALRRIGDAGAVVARPAREVEKAKTNWLDWHRTVSSHTNVQVANAHKPLVSVCMSHFSRPYLLRCAIESIELQTYEPIEVILVDDASPDPETHAYLEEIAPRFAARGWKILRNTEEMWTGAARNHAVNHATGEYVLLMDDDNVAKPYEIEVFIKAALHTGADVLTCQQQPFQGTCSPPSNDAELPIGWIPIGPALSLALYENCLGDLNMMVRREAWQKLGGFTEERYGCEDYEFLGKAVLEGFKLECIPEILFYYRMSDTNLAHRYDSAALYSSFSRIVRPYLEHVRPDLAMALLFASNLTANAVRDRKEGYWRFVRTDVASQRIAALPLNTGAALVELAKAALERGQSETAGLLYGQALRVSSDNKNQNLDSLLLTAGVKLPANKGFGGPQITDDVAFILEAESDQ
jgi:GT2 family glycosyltransferase/glycosyltransferase involved in cell wall biosynthesis